MLCLLSLPLSGPYGSQRTTWPHRITCKYLLYTSDSTRASRTCRHAAALGHRQTKSHNCNVLDVSCAHFLRLYSITIMTSKWPVTLAARPTDISVYIQPCFPEEGGTQRILSSHSCRLQGFFRCHSPDVLQNTCLFAVHRAYGLTALQTHTHTHTHPLHFSALAHNQAPPAALLSPPSLLSKAIKLEVMPAADLPRLDGFTHPQLKRRAFSSDTFGCF